MKNWKLLSAMTLIVLTSTSAYAVDSSSNATTILVLAPNTKLHWVMALNASGAIAQPGKTQTLQATGDANNYVNDGKLQTNLSAGAFVGLDLLLSQILNYQLGFAYNTILPYALNGEIQQLGQAQFTGFNYDYKIQSQQLFLQSKLVFNAAHHLHPYVSFGLGSALNKAYDFSTTALDPRATNPGTFSDHSTMQFAYAVGLGMDVDVAKHVRIGGGYRFANLGKADLGAASDFSSNKGLSTSLLTHELVVTATYIF
ncbi:MAG: hypothetical protein EXR81_04640 [Gammaproteobacteria bacterium]|nr:hypothetical protein [Gammaproteobacteria bacterium]